MITILTLSLVFFFFSKSLWDLKRKRSISWEIKRGIVCYSCKGKNSEIDPAKLITSSIDYSKDDIKLCTSCDRDQKLDDLVKKGLLRKSFKNRVKKHLLLDKYTKKLPILHISFILVFFLIDLSLNLIGYKTGIFVYFTSIINVLYAVIFYYKNSLSIGGSKLIFED